MHISLGTKKYALNTFWLISEKFIRLFSGVFIGIWIARYLGPEKYGAMMYAISFVSIFFPFASLGVDGVFAKFYLDNEKAKGIVSTSILLKVMGATIAFVIVNLAAFLLHTSIELQLLMALFSLMLFFNVSKVLERLFIAELKSSIVALSSTVSILLSSLIKIYIILSGGPTYLFIVAMLIEAFVASSILLFRYIKSDFHRASVSRQCEITIPSFISHSWPLIFSASANAIFMKMDLIMVRAFLGNTDAGQYAVAMRLSDVWLIVTVAITQALFPAIVNAKKVDSKIYETRLKALFQLLIVMACFIAITINLFASEIIFVLFGTSYEEAESVIRIYIWVLIFIFLNNAAWTWYINEGIQKLVAYRMIFGAILNIVLNLLLIPLWGIEGAAIATIFSYSVTTFWSNIFFKQTRKVFLLQLSAIYDILKLKLDWNAVKSR